jgi:hypothetical protein
MFLERTQTRVNLTLAIWHIRPPTRMQRKSIHPSFLLWQALAGAAIATGMRTARAKSGQETFCHGLVDAVLTRTVDTQCQCNEHRQRLYRWEKAFSVGGTQALDMVKQRIFRQQIEDRITVHLTSMDSNTTMLKVCRRTFNIHGSRFSGCDSGDEQPIMGTGFIIFFKTSRLSKCHSGSTPFFTDDFKRLETFRSCLATRLRI